MSSDVSKSYSTKRLRRSVSQLALAESQDLVLWKQPLATMYHLVMCLYDNAVYLYNEIVRNKILIICGVIIFVGFYFLDKLEGPHQVSNA